MIAMDKDEFRDFAVDIMGGDTAAAASLGYDVSSAVVDHVIKSLPELGVERMTWKRGAPGSEFVVWMERESPREDALVLADMLRVAVATVPRPRCVTIEVGRVVRVHDRRDQKKWTAVAVHVKSPLTGERVVLYTTETT